MFLKRIMELIFFFIGTLIIVWFFAVDTMKNRLTQEVSHTIGLTAEQFGQLQNEFVLDINNRNPALAKGLARAQLTLYANIEDSIQNWIDQDSAFAWHMICSYKEISRMCSKAHLECPIMLSGPAKGILFSLESDKISWLEKRAIEVKLVKLLFGMNFYC